MLELFRKHPDIVENNFERVNYILNHIRVEQLRIRSESIMDFATNTMNMITSAMTDASNEVVRLFEVITQWIVSVPEMFVGGMTNIAFEAFANRLSAAGFGHVVAAGQHVVKSILLCLVFQH